MKICVIMPAAGASVRYQAAGAVRHKLDEDLGGKPLIQRTVETFTKFDDDEATIASILVAGPHDDADFAAFTDRHGDRLSLLGAKLVKGGPTYRWQTVAAALAHVRFRLPCWLVSFVQLGHTPQWCPRSHAATP
jgi:2-C-methyl-D-erythritol 4-phosphate cytidylyltransferase